MEARCFFLVFVLRQNFGNGLFPFGKKSKFFSSFSVSLSSVIGLFPDATSLITIKFKALSMWFPGWFKICLRDLGKRSPYQLDKCTLR